MKHECPICGRPFSMLDVVLADCDVRFQCPHCWSRVHATGPVRRDASPALRKPRLSHTRRGALARRRGK